MSRCSGQLYCHKHENKHRFITKLYNRNLRNIASNVILRQRLQQLFNVMSCDLQTCYIHGVSLLVDRRQHIRYIGKLGVITTTICRRSLWLTCTDNTTLDGGSAAGGRNTSLEQGQDCDICNSHERQGVEWPKVLLPPDLHRLRRHRIPLS